MNTKARPQVTGDEPFGRDPVIRQSTLDTLRKKGAVVVSDLQGTHRYLRIAICDELWSLCDADAKSYLLNDLHHHVRSCAEIAQMEFNKLLALYAPHK